MAIEGLRDLSSLSVVELYAVYVGIARADWAWRRTAVYGTTEPPSGHAVFRPLSLAAFQLRMKTAKSIVRGDWVLRNRLSRQAAAYRVDVDAVIADLAKAA